MSTKTALIVISICTLVVVFFYEPRLLLPVILLYGTIIAFWRADS